MTGEYELLCNKNEGGGGGTHNMVLNVLKVFINLREINVMIALLGAVWLAVVEPNNNNESYNVIPKLY